MQGRELRKLYFKHTMAKNSKVGILLEFNYEEPEFLYPYYRFKEAGFETVSIGPSTDTVYKGKHGYPFKAEVSIQDIKPEELAALIIPGGFAPDYWRRDKRFLDLIRQMNDLGRPLAAICHGPWMFCSAKILKGKRATGFVAIKDDIENAGAIYEDAPVVVDGNLITSRMPKDLPDFCKAILDQLS
ncbi:uncharacterized protein LOC112562879 [Pomacea canaliculata]|uniref:uncharacterized protein LOC112562879 n=1 Tax=Pomacea canaliculata TaxID=400727 RepID=UPI000D72E5EE|nr:uncharacterized protein LOC112562879 [Pomacea canaliculata]